MPYDLRRLQLTQLEILCEVQRVCERNNISFFLYGGTLLGAIRHQGFIPWDDDLDIGMLRDDYERFLDIAPREMNKKYLLQTWRNDPGYAWPFAKVQKVGTICQEIISANANKMSGIYIDIFPLDVFPSNAHMQKSQGKKIELFRYLSLMKCGYKQWLSSGRFDLKKYLKYLPFRFLAMFYKKEQICKVYEDSATRFNKSGGESLFPQSIRHYGTLSVPRKDFEKTIMAPFEGKEFPIPIGYENYLVSAYGDWETLPPENERGNRHGVLKVDFGE